MYECIFYVYMYVYIYLPRCVCVHKHVLFMYRYMFFYVMCIKFYVIPKNKYAATTSRKIMKGVQF